jgi:hypothetical protein
MWLARRILCYRKGHYTSQYMYPQRCLRCWRRLDKGARADARIIR